MNQMPKIAFKIIGMDCAEEVAILKKEIGLRTEDGGNLDFDILNGKMIVSSDKEDINQDDIIRAVRRTGMTAVPWEEFRNSQIPIANSGIWARRGRLATCSISGLLLIAGFVTQAIYTGHILTALSGDSKEAPLTIIFFFGAAIAGAWFIAPKAWFSLRKFRPDMNLLMSVAAVGAMILGEWFEAATVTFLFSLALLLESWSVGRARKAIGALMDLSPAMARVICPHDGNIEEMPVHEVLPGAVVIVRPGERIPLDGIVTKGTSSVNQAPITGESFPVSKTIGDDIFAGTINNEGAFEFKVTRPATDTTLARIIHLVEEAQSRRAPSEQWVQKFARYYTPSMMGLAIFIAVFHPLVFDGNWARWFYEALVILVIACPCALVISTPVSIVAGLTSSARAGVLIKGGAYLEAPAHLKAIAIDKTGTLTHGHPEVQEIIPFSGHTPAELLARAAALESFSEHPLARAILRKAEGNNSGIAVPQEFCSIQGKGAEAFIDGRLFWIGSHRLIHERGGETPEFHAKAEELERAGHSVIAIGNDNHICGLISVADSIRTQAKEMIAELKKAGIKHIIMLTGDNNGTAKAVASATGVDEFQAELLPEDKVIVIESLIKKYKNVAMVGDGVNDAPAMAVSSIGIAMGAVGSDAAIETADIALMSDDLTKLPWLIHHSRRVLSVIKQNIWFALGLKALFLVLALAGLATLWMAIAADMGASLLVILNSLRLLQSKA